MCISFSLIVHQLLMYLGKISRLIDVFGFGSVYSNCFLQKQATLVLLLLDFFFSFFQFFKNNLVNYCCVLRMWKTAEIASWALYMSPGDNTAVMNSETKQTKRGRLKQEAQHRYCFATPWYHRRPCSELWKKKPQTVTQKVQIIRGRVYKDTSQPERNTYISLHKRCLPDVG